MKRSHLIAVIAVAAAVLVASIVSVAVFSRRVQVISGVRVECVYGHVVKEDIETVKVRPSEASEYGVKTKTVVCADHRKAEKLYDEAQAALAKGDYKAAQAKLAEVVVIDRAFKRANVQLAELDAGKKPDAATDTGSATPPAAGTGAGGTSGSGTGTGGTGTGGTGSDGEDPGSAPTGPIASLASWMPEDLAGYTPDPVVADALSISREYVASDEKSTLVISAEQIGSVSGVADALKSRVRLPYDQDDQKVTIGARSGYAGTDGRSVAVVGLADGPVIVTFQLTTPGKDPKGSIATLLAIAKTLPR